MTFFKKCGIVITSKGMMPREKNQKNDRTQVEKVETNAMKTEKDIKSAIARSVSHNEIVMCPVQSLLSGPRAVEQYAFVEDYCVSELPNFEYRIIDVWGKTYEGAEFRLYLFAPEEAND